MGAQPLSESATLSSPSRVRGAASGSFRGQGVTEGSNSFSPKVFAQFIGVCSRPTVVVALTPRTLEGPILPAQHMDGGWTRFGVEEVVQMRNHRHGRAAPWITGSVKNRSEDSQLTIEGLRCYKPREIERPVLPRRRPLCSRAMPRKRSSCSAPGSRSIRHACLSQHTNYSASNWSLQDNILLFPHWSNGCLGHVSDAYASGHSLPVSATLEANMRLHTRGIENGVRYGRCQRSKMC